MNSPDPYKKKQSSMSMTQIILIIGLLAFPILLLMLKPIKFDKTPLPPPKPRGPAIEKIYETVSEVLVAYQLNTFSVTDKTFQGQILSVQVPSDLPLHEIHLAIQDGIQQIGAEMLPSKSEPISGKVTLRVGWPDSCLMQVVLWPIKTLKREQGRIAILIDDFGDRWDSFTQAFLDLPGPISLSIIPGLPYSNRVVQEAKLRGCETLMHLPMQPKGKYTNFSPYMIERTMTRDESQSVVRKAIEALPDVSGINNHMGSLVTADRRMMGHVLEEVKQHQLFFLDSRTTSESVVYDVAHQWGVPTAKRDVFLDNTRTESAVRIEMARLVERASKHGSAIGIGHANSITLEMLREQIPQLTEAGYRFVRISDLVR